MQPLSDSESAYLLLFGLLPSVGQGRLRQLVHYSQSQGVSLASLWSQGKFPSKIVVIENVDKEIQKIKNEYTIENYQVWLAKQNIRVLFSWQSEYPYWLTLLERPPLLLFAQGNIDLLQAELPVAIIGSRAVSGYGRQTTKLLTKQLVESGGCIVSGFMYGVDTIAHQAAIDHGGTTIAVLGYGHMQSFPRQHISLRERWLQTNRAVFLSPFWPKSPAVQACFPIRNAIVAGLSLAVVVTEAAAHSGSHITAERALEYNRVVCAVPGPISNPTSEGTKSLINQGACLVSSGQDVLREIEAAHLTSIRRSTQDHTAARSGQGMAIPEILTVGLSDIEIVVLHSLFSGSLTFEQLMEEVELSPAELSQVLSQLEVKGKVERFGEEFIPVL